MGDSFHQPLYPGGFFHVYNRGNNKEQLFHAQSDYEYFLRKYQNYLSGWVDTFAFCLIPNHFHLLLRVKEFEGAAEGTSEGLRRLFISYAQTINLIYDRSGSLFRKNFNRLPVENDSYFLNLVLYIHLNPVQHSVTSDFRDYPWSSYPLIVNNIPGFLNRGHILDRFGSLEKFIQFHKDQRRLKAFDDGSIEE
jgi:REP element-mobilizing transposase RayT